jgi:hypothetical protein
MPQIFHRSFNTLSRVSIAAVVLGLLVAWVVQPAGSVGAGIIGGSVPDRYSVLNWRRAACGHFYCDTTDPPICFLLSHHPTLTLFAIRITGPTTFPTNDVPE